MDTYNDYNMVVNISRFFFVVALVAQYSIRRWGITTFIFWERLGKRGSRWVLVSKRNICFKGNYKWLLSALNSVSIEGTWPGLIVLSLGKTLDCQRCFSIPRCRNTLVLLFPSLFYGTREIHSSPSLVSVMCFLYWRLVVSLACNCNKLASHAGGGGMKDS